jgi:hypothetical protein
LATWSLASDRTRPLSPDGSPDLTSGNASRHYQPDGLTSTRNRRSSVRIRPRAPQTGRSEHVSVGTWPQEARRAIKKRGNSWWVVVYTGRDPLTGKKRQKTGTAKIRAEARQLEAKLIREAGTGQHRAAGNKTVAELLDAWSEWRPRKGEIAERTMLGYRSLTEHKIIPALGELRLSRWTPPPSTGSWPNSANGAPAASTASTWSASGKLRCGPATDIGLDPGCASASIRPTACVGCP